MLNASDAPSGSSISHTTQPPPDAPVIVLTSVLTETIHPTWVVTEVTTIEPTSASRVQSDTDIDTAQPHTTAQYETVQTVQVGMSSSSVSSDSAETVTSTAAQPQTTQPETLQSSSTGPAQSSVPSTSPTTSSTQPMESPLLTHDSGSSESWAAIMVHSSSTSSLDPTPLASTSSSSQFSMSTTWTWTTSTSPTTRSSTTDAATQSTPSLSQIITALDSQTSSSPSSASSTRSATSSFTSVSVISGAAASNASSAYAISNSTHVGAIVGGTLGGTAVVALGLLACAVFFRRRRRRPSVQRQNSHQRLLCANNSLSSHRGPHGRHRSQPSFPITRSAIPSAPVFPPRRYSDAPLPPNQQHAGDPENSPVSPIIQVQPPSRTASSSYSRCSWEGGMDLLDCYEYDSSGDSSRYGQEHAYYPGGSATSIPHTAGSNPHLAGDRLAPRSASLDTPKTRLSTRSDPFDLEPPPTALRKWPPLPPRATPWGRNF
ncbi:hypothetical protein N7462_009957 [Penicillium macrosclerotiorum]|uniref:uncharacterized protein n=1 Tax=Penicillium macrosclerotiorum TaxID=303699 RepID=UPI00254925F5|nr:uncharacterized protein N7462_009957 [Penicillium macrosclerotiorum]KAJ5668887.1 hypothetical protein N7462_009957 [Penicillium macrosclerotiorum]